MVREEIENCTVDYSEGVLTVTFDYNEEANRPISFDVQAPQPSLFDKIVKMYKEYKSWQEDEENKYARYWAEQFLQIQGIDSSHPEYLQRVQEETERYKQDRDMIMGFSGGIKVMQGVTKLGNVANGLRKAETELHHIATDKSKVFDFKNHPVFKETRINISKDIDNLVELAGHRGRHTNTYHQEVQRRLDAVYERFGGTDKLENAVRNELNIMRQELLDGTLNPY